MSITIRQVASHAGVSRGTVSRVLNDSPRVDAATRARVLASMAALQYTPSVAARRLSLGRTMTVAVILPFLTRPSSVERLRGIEAALVERGYDLIVLNVETAERRDVVFREVLRPDRVDGVIVISLLPRDEELERFRAVGMPVVLIDSHHRWLDRVITDDVGGGRMAAQHLLDLGHRRIAFVGDPPRSPLSFSSSRLRFRGMRAAMDDAGALLDARLVVTLDHGRAQAAAATRDLLTRRDPPTAIFAPSDVQALGVLEAATSLGRAVPGDVSVIGYDDIEVAGLMGLSTVRQPLFETGVAGVRRLFQRMSDAGPGAQRDVRPVELVARRTTAPVAAHAVRVADAVRVARRPLPPRRASGAGPVAPASP